MKLYLHIGVAKTGTTSIQDFLYLNRALLARQGVLYPASVVDQVISLYDCRSHNSMCWNQQWARSTQRLRSEMLASGCSRVILSSEILQQQLNCVGQIREFHSWLVQLGFEHIEVIVYLREPGAWFCSYISQLVRNSTIRRHYADDLTQLLPEHYDDPRNILDYRETLEDWGAVFGREHLHVRLFERSFLHEGDLLRDFLQVLKLDWNEDFQIPKQASNERLNLLEIELFRSINNICPGHTLDIRNSVRRIIYLRAGRHLGGTSEPRLRFSPPPPLIEAVREWCRENHEWVRQHCFSECVQLFDCPQLPGQAALQQLQPSDWDRLAALVADLAGQLVQSRRQILMLQRQLQQERQAAVQNSSAPAPTPLPPPGTAEASITALLQRAQVLLGTPPASHDDPQLELLQLLCGLYRAQTRLDHEQLRRLGHDCLRRMSSQFGMKAPSCVICVTWFMKERSDGIRVRTTAATRCPEMP